MRRKIFLCVFVFILATLVFNRDAYSDFGSFSGNSDYGSSSSSSSGGYSSGSSTRRSVNLGSSNNFNVLPLTAGTLGGSNSDDIEGVILVFVLVIIFFFLIKMKKSKHNAPIMINTDIQAQNLRPMNEYLELDPNFDEEKIKTLMANLYVQMQDTWRDKDISSLRPYMTDAFYNQMERQLEAFRKNHRTDYTERIAVLNVGLKGWRQSAGRDYITVRLNSRIVSYVLDDLTGKLISGDRDKEKFLEYEIELTRKSGEFTTPEAEGAKSEVCPHCGAPIKLNASAKCEYCGSIITAVNINWAICSMKGISQRTA
ncbi:MAG: TIM44-like domain-containing protein [Synergistaceae bacterium]|nr:TIM44-like domain-containing protein [Synergistaceae bacterium]